MSKLLIVLFLGLSSWAHGSDVVIFSGSYQTEAIAGHEAYRPSVVKLRDFTRGQDIVASLSYVEPEHQDMRFRVDLIDVEQGEVIDTLISEEGEYDFVIPGDLVAKLPINTILYVYGFFSSPQFCTTPTCPEDLDEEPQISRSYRIKLQTLFDGSGYYQPGLYN